MPQQNLNIRIVHVLQRYSQGLYWHTAGLDVKINIKILAVEVLFV